MTDRGKRVLVIDDSPEYLGFMDALLTAEGFCVDVAQTVPQVYEHLAAVRPDLIISDVRMPGIAAFGVVDLIRADEKLRDIPVLFCTGAVQEVAEARGGLHGADIEVLFKPFDIDDLLARIARMLP